MVSITYEREGRRRGLAGPVVIVYCCLARGGLSLSFVVHSVVVYWCQPRVDSQQIIEQKGGKRTLRSEAPHTVWLWPFSLVVYSSERKLSMSS